MSRVLRLVERVQSDVDDIFSWLAQRSVSGAISWYLAFRAALEKIADNPENFAEAPEADRLNRPLRQALFKTRRGRMYRIIFTMIDSDILLLRVRGPGQRPLRQNDVPKE